MRGMQCSSSSSGGSRKQMEFNSRRIRCQESLNSSGLCVPGIQAPPFRPQQPAVAVGITSDLMDAFLGSRAAISRDAKVSKAHKATFGHLIVRQP